MLSLNTRIEILGRLGDFLKSDSPEWEETKARAAARNPWFTPENLTLATQAIALQFLDREKLTAWTARYPLPAEPKTVGIVMAGNIPLVGFHDFLCGFVAGHYLQIKLSSKDEVLLPELLRRLTEMEPAVFGQARTVDKLSGCDAYIATGSNNSARYFQQYFGKKPHLIRQSRTSVAVLNGGESAEELRMLADDVFQHFGLGCRNVTQIQVPRSYDFKPLFEAFSPYAHLIDNHKYKNNYDYHLAIYLLNRVPYQTNESVLLVENSEPFSAIASLHYAFYDDPEDLLGHLRTDERIQTIVGGQGTPFGAAQCPALSDYADGVDTMAFLTSLPA